MQQRNKYILYAVAVFLVSILSSIGVFYYLKNDGFSVESAMASRAVIIEKAKNSQDPTIINSGKIAS